MRHPCHEARSRRPRAAARRFAQCRGGVALLPARRGREAGRVRPVPFPPTHVARCTTSSLRDLERRAPRHASSAASCMTRLWAWSEEPAFAGPGNGVKVPGEIDSPTPTPHPVRIATSRERASPERSACRSSNARCREACRGSDGLMPWMQHLLSPTKQGIAMFPRAARKRRCATVLRSARPQAAERHDRRPVLDLGDITKTPSHEPIAISGAGGRTCGEVRGAHHPTAATIDQERSRLKWFGACAGCGSPAVKLLNGRDPSPSRSRS